jgi:3-oxoacyl-[acyl-carrier-protein] synthase III
MNTQKIEPKLSGSYAVKPAIPVGIVALGMYVPPKILKNRDFINLHLTPEEEAFFNTDPHFAKNERRIAENESVADMAIKASKNALETYKIDPKSIDLVLFTSNYKDMYRLAPPMANYIQTSIGADNANSFNIDCGFNGWLPALTTGVSFIASGFYKTVLVVTGEIVSIDCSTSEALFMGDGAGAIVLKQVSEGEGMLSFHLMSKECEEAAGIKITGGLGTYNSDKWEIKPYLYIVPGSFARDIPYLEHYIPYSIGENLKILLKTPDDVDCYIFGQQYYGLNVTWSKNIGVDYSKVYDTLKNYGCMKCANIPVTLADAVKNGKIKKGDIIAFGDQGANWSISSAVFKWCI